MEASTHRAATVSIRAQQMTDLEPLRYFKTDFFVILHGTGMNRCGQTFQHALFGQTAVGRMKLFEIVEVVKHFFDDGVNDLIRYLCWRLQRWP